MGCHGEGETMENKQQFKKDVHILQFVLQQDCTCS